MGVSKVQDHTRAVCAGVQVRPANGLPILQHHERKRRVSIGERKGSLMSDSEIDVHPVVRSWVSVMDEMPPVNTWVETMGAEKGKIIKDYFHASFGDWMYNRGDPTHWRFLAND